MTCWEESNRSFIHRVGLRPATKAFDKELFFFAAALILSGCGGGAAVKDAPVDERSSIDPVTYQALAPNSEYSTGPGKPYYRVWYGTNRRPIDPTKPKLGYSNIDDQRMHYGTAIVNVPKSHKFGSVGSSWFVRKLVVRADDRLKLEELRPMSRTTFQDFMGQKLSSRDPGKRSALVYIHGYNTKFEEAVIRAAQIGYDLKVEGVTALFSWPSLGTSWPSLGTPFAYSADEATVGASEIYLEEFLRDIIKNPNVEDVNVLAHSMGNRALLRAVERLALDATLPSKPINQILLAAPDVDSRTFAQLADHYLYISNQTTLYVSSKDLALKTSGIVHNYPRAGFTPPVTVIPSIDTVTVKNIDLTILGHRYFAEAEAVLYDMFHLLQTNVRAGNRIRLRSKLSPSGQQYWEIAR